MPNQFRLLVSMFAHINAETFYSLIKNSTDFHQLSLNNEFWKTKFQLHFPDSFAKLEKENTTLEKSYNWLEEFFLCFQDSYKHLTPKHKMLISWIKEDDREALTSFPMELTDLDQVFDSHISSYRDVLSFALSLDQNNVVQEMLSRDKNILNAKNKFGAIPLFHAIVNKDLKIVGKLLSLGADPSIRLEGLHDYYKNLNLHENDTPLHAAITLNLTEIVNCLLKANADPNALTKEGLNSLQLAAELNHADIVNLICESKKVNIDDCTDIGMTALMLAIINKNLQATTTLLNQKADPSIPRSKSKEDNLQLTYEDINKIQIGDAPIHVAAKFRSDDYISLLVKHGASLEQTNSTGENALRAAVIAGRMDIVKLLLTFPDCKINSLSQSGATSLLLATELGLNEIALLLIEKGADIDIPLATYSLYHRKFGVGAGDTPLAVAIHLENTELATVLMKLHTENKMVYRQLLCAVRKNDLETLKKMEIPKLSRNKINTIHPSTGLTLLHSAVAEGFNEVALQLLKMGADETIPARRYVTYKNKVIINEKDTPLHTAARLGNEMIAHALIQKNPWNVEKTNLCQLTPIHLVQDKKSTFRYSMQLTKLKLDIHRYSISPARGGLFSINHRNSCSIADIKNAVNAMKKVSLHKDDKTGLSVHVKTIEAVPELRFVYKGLGLNR